MEKIKFTRAFFQEFQNNPKGFFTKHGLNPEDASQEFWNNDFKNMSFDEFEQLVKKSRLGGFFDF